MALLFTESFDAHPTSSAAAIKTYLDTKWGQFLTGYTGLQGGVTFVGAGSNLGGGVAGRHGTGFRFHGGPSISTQAEIWFDPTTTTDTKIIGYACNITTNVAGGTQRWYMPVFYENPPSGQISPHIGISPISFGSSVVVCRVWRGQNTVVENAQVGSDFALPMNTWIYLEIKCKVHPTAGEITIRQDGNVIFTFTGNTKNTAGSLATPYINRLFFFDQTANSPANFQATIDDLYVCDDTGASPFNTYLGDVTVEYKQPMADAAVLWTPSAGSNWDCVADAPATTVPITTDYVQSNIDDQLDLYQLEDSAYGSPNTIYAVATYAYADKSDSGGRNLAVVQDLSGTQVQSADQSLLYSGNGGPRYLRFMRQQDPTGAAWTIANFNALRIGVKARP